MKSVISAIVICIALFVGGTAFADNVALREILRTAALKNGLRPPQQLFVDRDAELADIGKRFFESTNMSLNGKMACRTCHLDRFGSADGLPNAVGVFGSGEGPDRAMSEGRIVPRNTLPLWGRGAKGFDTFFWDGKVDFSNGKRISQFGDQTPADDPLLVAVHLPPVEIREMITEDATVSAFKREAPDVAAALYVRITDNLRTAEPGAMVELGKRIGKPAEALTFRDVARSIAAFIGSAFRLEETKFHRFVFGDEELSGGELEGGLIFYGKGKCVNCHNGPHFSDFGFHAVPFPQVGFGKNGFGVDYGRFNVTFDPKDLYRFRTPPLFNVEKTGPYGHSGSAATLDAAIVAHFDPLRGVDPRSMDGVTRHELFKRLAATAEEFTLLSVLSDHEVSQVEAFLRTLSFN